MIFSKIFRATFILFFFGIVLVPTVSAQSGQLCSGADINRDGFVDISDYAILVRNFFRTCGSTSPSPRTTIRPSATPRVRATATPRAIATARPTPSASTTPIEFGNGIVISVEQLRSLPITGQSNCGSGTLCASAWNGIVNKANSNWGSPSLDTYNVVHPPGVLAGAIAAQRLSVEPGREAEATALRTKTINALLSIIGTEMGATSRYDGSLSLCRHLGTYVIAADILGLYPDGNSSSPGSRLGAFFQKLSTQKFAFRDGETIAENHEANASNGNSMCGGTRVALDVYLKNKTDLDKAWLTFRRYTGDRSVGPSMGRNSYSETWVHSKSSYVGINPVGSTCNNGLYPADGAIPNDQGRGGSCPTNINSAPGYTQYPWEGLQGVYLQALVLQRAGYSDASGKSPWDINDKALLRALEYQWSLQNKFGGSWYDSSRAAWVKHLAFKVYGYKPKEYASVDGGRNFDYAQWLYP